jgi:hypothetical protein
MAACHDRGAHRASDVKMAKAVGLEPAWKHQTKDSAEHSWTDFRHFCDKVVSRQPNVIPRAVVEDCEIVRVSDPVCCLRLGLQFATVPRAGKVDGFACCAQGAAARHSNSTGRGICMGLPAEAATISATPACKSTMRDSIGFSKFPTEKSYALLPKTRI